MSDTQHQDQEMCLSHYVFSAYFTLQRCPHVPGHVQDRVQRESSGQEQVLGDASWSKEPGLDPLFGQTFHQLGSSLHLPGEVRSSCPRSGPAYSVLCFVSFRLPKQQPCFCLPVLALPLSGESLSGAFDSFQSSSENIQVLFKE